MPAFRESKYVFTERNVTQARQANTGPTSAIGRSAEHIKLASQTALGENRSEDEDIENIVYGIGGDLQERVRATPMDHLNRNPLHFADRCRQIYKQYGNNFQFAVLLLAGADPLHYDARSQLTVGRSSTQPQQYFGTARPVSIPTKHGGSIYTLQVQVIGARVSDVLRQDMVGASLATALATQRSVTQKTRSGLSGLCMGEKIAGMADLNHLATVLTVAGESSAHTPNKPGNILSTISKARGSQPQHIGELAHTHGLPPQTAHQLGTTLLSNSTALNPLVIDGNNTFIVHPHLTDPVIIIPLNGELATPGQILKPHSDQQQAVASLALGTLATFGLQGIDDLYEKVVLPSQRGNQIPLAVLKQISRT